MNKNEEIIIDENGVMQEEVSEILFNPNELIKVEQLPIITEQLAALSQQIDNDVAAALSLECSEENKQAVKKARTRLTKDFAVLEERRKIVKAAIDEPYKKFNAIYEEHVAKKYSEADKELKAGIDKIETEQKNRLKKELVAYFYEYLLSKNIDFVKLEDAGIRVGVSDNLTNLKKQAKTFIDRIADDVALIDTQEYQAEIFVEYKKTLNCSQAITTVSARHKAIEEQKARQAETDAKKQELLEAVAKVEAAIPTIQPLEPPKTESIKKTEPVKPEPIYTLSFKVKGTKSQLMELKNFIIERGYKYE